MVTESFGCTAEWLKNLNFKRKSLYIIKLQFLSNWPQRILFFYQPLSKPRNDSFFFSCLGISDKIRSSPFLFRKKSQLVRVSNKQTWRRIQLEKKAEMSIKQATHLALALSFSFFYLIFTIQTKIKCVIFLTAEDQSNCIMEFHGPNSDASAWTCLTDDKNGMGIRYEMN